MFLSNPSVRVSWNALSLEPINFFQFGFRLMFYQGLSSGIDGHPSRSKVAMV